MYTPYPPASRKAILTFNYKASIADSETQYSNALLAADTAAVLQELLNGDLVGYAIFLVVSLLVGGVGLLMYGVAIVRAQVFARWAGYVIIGA